MTDMTTTPTVSVPVEPTEAMMRAWHQTTWPTGPAISPLSQQGLSFARAYRAMLAAAPALTARHEAPAEGAGRLLRPSGSKPPRCYCPPDRCDAPVIMGRQTPCIRARSAPVEGAITADSLRSVSDETMRALLSCKDVGSGRAHLAHIMNALRACAPEASPQVEAFSRDQLIEYLEQELSGAYDCNRVWSAWSVGTMGEDDFSPVSDRIEEIADAILDLYTHPQPAQTPGVGGDALREAVIEAILIFPETADLHAQQAEDLADRILALTATQPDRGAKPADGGLREAVEAGDAKWLTRLLGNQRDGGHCGEGTFERRERADWNDRIDRIIAALAAGESAK